MRYLNTLLTVSFLSASLSAQVPPEINKRRENQQDRVAAGVKSGQLTAGETARIEGREAGINKEVRRDRRANGGNLTNNEKAKVNRQENRVSKQIFKDKHNTTVQR